MNLKIIRLVIFFIFVGFVSVLSVQLSNKGSVWVETLKPQNFSDSSPQTGLQLIVQTRQLQIIIPECKTYLFPEKFFLHLYPEVSEKNSSEDFINLDFFLSNSKVKWEIKNNTTTCFYTKKFPNINVRKVEIGQFNMPKQQCCRILWSRTFHPNHH